MADTVQIGLDDGCAGLETGDGRLFHARDHTVELPASEARRFFGSGAPNLHVRHRIRRGWTPRSEGAWERAFPHKES